MIDSAAWRRQRRPSLPDARRPPRAGLDAVRGVYERVAPRYDPMMNVLERMLFSGGRHWVTSRAGGDILDIAAGTGRNLPLYTGDRIVAVELSPAMVSVAAQLARCPTPPSSLSLTRSGCPSLTRRSTAPSSRLRCAASPTPVAPSPKPGACCARAVGCSPWNTFAAPEPLSAPRNEGGEPVFIRAMCDHLLREPVEEVTAAGFRIEEIERSKFGIVERLSASKPA